MRALPVAVVIATGAFGAEIVYQKPPQAILDVLHAPEVPRGYLSPSGDYLLLGDDRQYPPIAELAEPMLALAGQRINPRTNGPHRGRYLVSLRLVPTAGGAEVKIALPPGARITAPEWSPDGKQFAFTHTTATGVEAWVGDTAGRLRRLRAGVSAAFGDALRWMPDSRTLLVQLIPASRGRPPEESAVPSGPHVRESTRRAAPVWTLQDLLKNPHDENLFDYYATAQLALVDTAEGKTTPLGRPAIFETAEPSPDGKLLLVARLVRPFSYLQAASAFPKEVEVWDRAGKLVHKLASLPLADQVPVEGVPVGPRLYHWRLGAPATVGWVEALDGGDPKKNVPHRDRVMLRKAPFDAPAVEVLRTEQRTTGYDWGERGVLLVREFERRRLWRRVFLVDPDQGTPARVAWSLSARDRYQDPGDPVTRPTAGGQKVIIQEGDWIYLNGTGSTPQGDRPFLDRYHWKTGQTERLFRSAPEGYERVEGMVGAGGEVWLTKREGRTGPPNYFVRTGGKTEARGLTRFADPTPQLRKIQKKLVTYRRADGVALSFTLYLPPDYQAGTRLPTVVWAYPREFADPGTAGQVGGSAERFTTVSGTSHLFLLLAGYAVLDNATMPVVGDPDTANNTYVEQIVSGAKAAIDKAAELGVTDPKRVAVGGHSYGAFMTANLLAHSDLFRAGIARSGAYNRTLTPFGFQFERRTFWEAPDLYLKMSPFVYANRINEPLLLIHGEADNNSGTFPVQSERMFHAVQGHGGTVRLVMLPHESHGYAARESVEHTLYEMVAWLDKWLGKD